MLVLFWASVVCRFLISPADFTIVRIMFAVTIIIFYYRILRIGYITKSIGPRVITIQAMVCRICLIPNDCIGPISLSK